MTRRNRDPDDASPDNQSGISDEHFARRWLRRKSHSSDASAAAEPGAPSSLPLPTETNSDADAAEDAAAARPTAEPADAGAPKMPDASGPEALGDEDMPSLESIDRGGPIDAFFSPRVSESLRQAALQRLFRRPSLNVMDGLDDYCEDYRNFTALGSLVTADMRHRMAHIAKRLEENKRLSKTIVDTTAQDNETPASSAALRTDAEPIDANTGADTKAQRSAGATDTRSKPSSHPAIETGVDHKPGTADHSDGCNTDEEIHREDDSNGDCHDECHDECHQDLDENRNVNRDENGKIADNKKGQKHP
ncbi:MAG: DUF3306 domain-containing protein [Wenzhouxiangellaceae bacterium]|nr:DUF3306 domain-containing protein [Wenzhouxiangellaceae bacterium]